jgi:hypothetical protein
MTTLLLPHSQLNESLDFAIKLGATTCLVEGHRRFNVCRALHVHGPILALRLGLGGDCSWTGCVPSKALIKVAKAAYHTRNAAKYGIQGVPDAGAVKADMGKVCDYVQSKPYHDVVPRMLDKLYQAPFKRSTPTRRRR